MPDISWLPTVDPDTGRAQRWAMSILPGVAVSTLGRMFNTTTRCFVKGFRHGRAGLGVQVKTSEGHLFKSVSRLVAETFVPTPAELVGQPLHVAHRNGDPLDNSVDNLTWVKAGHGQDLGDDFVPSASRPGERWCRFRSTQYYVSSHGRVFSAKSRALLSLNRDVNGYDRVVLSSVGSFFVHRLVAECFILRPEGRNTVNHIDGIKHNNTVENLEWVTAAENSRHAASTGLLATGSRHRSARFSDADVEAIRTLYRQGGLTYQDIANALSVSRTTVANAVQGKTRYSAAVAPTSTDVEVAVHVRVK
jgi:hypothetical protein